MQGQQNMFYFDIIIQNNMKKNMDVLIFIPGSYKIIIFTFQHPRQI